jgi:hypothetical protein
MEGNSAVTWRKSSFSGNNGGNCVEAASGAGTVWVRDTKDSAGAVLAFGADAWYVFADGIKSS